MLEDWQYDGSELRKIVLNNREKQYVLGTILGTSSLIWPKNALNPHLQMRESKNKGGNWLRCKAEELKRFSRKKSFIFDSDSFRWNSVSDTCWIDFYNLCYKDKIKNIAARWLDQLRDIGLAVWFIDKGYLTNRSCMIKISRLNKSSVAAIEDYFKIIDIPIKIKMHGGSKVISFENESRKKFLNLVSPCFPAFMRKTI